VIERSPEDYANHVQEMKAMYGDFSLAIEEILSDGDKVYVRWRQVGTVDKKDVTEIGSAVYLLKDGKIAEYWIQLDRKGIEEQMNN
jgi:predicted ester cyclase